MREVKFQNLCLIGLTNRVKPWLPCSWLFIMQLLFTILYHRFLKFFFTFISFSTFKCNFGGGGPVNQGQGKKKKKKKFISIQGNFCSKLCLTLTRLLSCCCCTFLYLPSAVVLLYTRKTKTSAQTHFCMAALCYDCRIII